MLTAFLIFVAAVRFTVGGQTLQPVDMLDGRAIAGGGGAPVVLLTLSPSGLRKLAALAASAPVAIDGKTVVARRIGTTIEIDGQTDFKAAAAFALRVSGKPPLPDSVDE